MAGQFPLQYRIEGLGPPAIVIGSVTMSRRLWSQALRKHLRLVFLDHRATVAAPGRLETTEYALDKVLDDIELARNQLELGRIVVIGHSGQSYMALEYAKKYPANVWHVVMVAIAPDLSPASAELSARHWNESVSPQRKAALARSLRRHPDDVLAKLPPVERVIRETVRDGARAWYNAHFDASSLFAGAVLNLDAFGHLWGKEFRHIDVTKGLAELNVPVFLALGRYDFLVAPPSSWDPVRPKFKNLTLRVFERSGHSPQYEEAALFDAELLSWIRKHR